MKIVKKELKKKDDKIERRLNKKRALNGNNCKGGRYLSSIYEERD